MQLAIIVFWGSGGSRKQSPLPNKPLLNFAKLYIFFVKHANGKTMELHSPELKVVVCVCSKAKPTGCICARQWWVSPTLPAVPTQSTLSCRIGGHDKRVIATAAQKHGPPNSQRRTPDSGLHCRKTPISSGKTWLLMIYKVLF
jgi:hypothetical protein